MKTLKQEAKELLEKFDDFGMDDCAVIQCALIHIDKMIKEKEECHKYECYGKSLKHYKKLKKELLKL